MASPSGMAQDDWIFVAAWRATWRGGCAPWMKRLPRGPCEKCTCPLYLALSPLSCPFIFEYEWNGFKCVFVIAFTDDFDTITHWYNEALPNAISSDEEDSAWLSFGR